MCKSKGEMVDLIRQTEHPSHQKFTLDNQTNGQNVKAYYMKDTTTSSKAKYKAEGQALVCSLCKTHFCYFLTVNMQISKGFQKQQ
jgi:hypothetical protein